VVAWNTADLVLEALDAIQAAARQCSGAVEILLVDNGGLDLVRTQIESRAHQVIRMVTNVNQCRARNYGAACAHGPVLVFLEDDGVIQEDYLANAERWFRLEELCAVRGRVIYKRHRYYTTLAAHYDLGPEPREDCLVTEGNMAIRRDPYLRAGGFREDLIGHEGRELTYRVKLQDPDALVRYVPDLVLRHDFADSWSKFRRKFSHYAGIDERLFQINPALKGFLEQYKALPHPEKKLTLDERMAHWLLTRIKRRLQRRARRSARKASAPPA